jgi:hypothetical protein
MKRAPSLTTIAELPDDAIARREMLEQRAMPSPDRPRVRPDIEARLAGLEERSAQCYVGMEEIIYRLYRLARDLNTTPTGEAE